MPAFPAFKTKPYYSELSNFLAVSIDLATGELLDSAVRPVVVSELADNQTVVDAAAVAVDANPTIADIGAALDGSADSSRAHRAHTGITIAAADSPAWMKRMADYVCDGTDDQVEWQAAIDASTAMVNTTTWSGFPNILPLAGTYNFSDTLIMKRASVDSLGGGACPVTIQWAGAAGGTVIAWESQATSFGKLAGMRITGGSEANHAGVLLDISPAAGTVDKMLGLEWLQFGGGDIQIDVGSWVNAHWQHLRFDGWREYAMRITSVPMQSHSSFSVSHFTADNLRDADPTHGNYGFVQYINGSGATANGFVSFSDARIELNRSWLNGPSGVFIQEGETGPEWSFDRLSTIYSNADTNHFLYVRSPGKTELPSISGSDLHLSGITSLLGGDVSPRMRLAIPANGRIGRLDTMSTALMGLHSLDFGQWNNDSDIIKTWSYEGNDPVYRVTQAGTQHLGRGWAALDTTVGRQGYGVYGTVDGNSIKAGSGAWDGGHLIMGTYHFWVDSTGDLRIKNGAPTSDTDGTVVGTQT